MPEETDFEVPKREKPEKEEKPTEDKLEKPTVEEPIEAEKDHYTRAARTATLEEAEEFHLAIPTAKVCLSYLYLFKYLNSF